MKTKIIFLWVVLIALSNVAYSQTNNPLSIYQGERIHSVVFNFDGLPSDSLVAINVKQKIENTFKIYPQAHYDSFMASYYLSQIQRYPFVGNAVLNLKPSEEDGIDILIDVHLTQSAQRSNKNISVFKSLSSLPTVYSDSRNFLTLKLAASQMVYTNDNAWFAQPSYLLNGNPLADNPVGAGYTGWIDGFVSGGLYGISKIYPKVNLHIYGGLSYIASFSAGAELFTKQARFHGAIEDAFIGLVGGWRSNTGHNYMYNFSYGRKQFALGDGWLLINTSMNGSNRAALQLNPRWSAKNLIEVDFKVDRMLIQVFQLKPDELPILNSKTTINGINLQLGNTDRLLIGLSYLNVPTSGFKYYLPDGQVHTREGLSVYNIRVFGNKKLNLPGFFYKAEIGYQSNSNFDMSAYAYYGEIGWSFTNKPTRPALSYRYAVFSGDDPDTKSYNRWDALYTGGNGEQWVQGSNMYKIVQNSNEVSHRIQLVFAPVKKTQVVAQLWAFYADQKLNLGGNPALSNIKSKYYGTEINLTAKYFQSKNWYFHLNTAFTLPGAAIKDIVPDTKNWFCLSGFARWSF